MKTVKICDLTLLKFEKTLSFKEKLEIARHLDNLKADVIYMPEIVNQVADSLLIRTVCSLVKNSTVSAVISFENPSVENAFEAIKGAKSSRIALKLPVSSVKMEYSLHKKAPKVLENASAIIENAVKCVDTEIILQDFTRADISFLTEIINIAVDKGVKVVTLCDDDGSMLPDDFSAFVADIIQKIPALQKVSVGVCCKDTNQMATASSVLSVKAGVSEVKCTACESDIPKFDVLSKVILNCGANCDFTANVNYNELNRIIKQIEWISGSNKGERLKEVEERVDENTVYDGSDDIKTIEKAIITLGYDLSDQDVQRVYDEFKRVADKKKVTLKDLDAIVASVALQVPPIYKLVSYVINNGNIINSSAQITLEKDGEEFSGIAFGDGPVDAAFRAVEQILGCHFELDQFQIQSVTEGKEAVGSAIVRLRKDGVLYSGNGISTDIIGASIRAYINAVNKIVYEEND